jgi:hypothetical protein
MSKGSRLIPPGWALDETASSETYKRTEGGHNLVAYQVHGTRRWRWEVANALVVRRYGFTGKQQRAVVAADAALKGITNG